MGKGLTRSELKQFEALLRKRRAILQGDVSKLENDALQTGSQSGSGNLSHVPLHIADLGTDSFEQDMSLGIMESESNELKQIEEALERIKDKSFGLCENCQKAIPKGRLKAIPYARFCVGCKKKEEGSSA